MLTKENLQAQDKLIRTLKEKAKKSWLARMRLKYWYDIEGDNWSDERDDGYQRGENIDF